MGDIDWGPDTYEGETSKLGGSPYGFDGSPNNRQPMQQGQQGGGNSLSGLAAALQAYGGGGVTAGGMNGFSGGTGDSFGTTTADFSPAMDLPAGY